MGDPFKVAVGLEIRPLNLNTFSDDDIPSLGGVGADLRMLWERDDETHGLNVSYSVGFPLGVAGPEAAHAVGVGYYWATPRGSFLGGLGRLTDIFEGFAIFLPTDVVMMGVKHQLGLELPLWDSEDGNRVTLTFGGTLSFQLLRVVPGPEFEATLGFGIGGFTAIGWSSREAASKTIGTQD